MLSAAAWRRTILALAVLGTFLVPVVAQAQETRYTKNRVVLREGRSTDTDPLLVIPKGSRLTVSSCEDRWCATRYGGENGYVYQPLLSREAIQAQEARPQRRSCCKICRKGKACGNSCISRRYTCHKGRGCACNG